MLWLTLLLACQTPEVAVQDATTPAHEAMRGHFFEAEAARDAVIDGDLEAVKAHARAVAGSISPAGHPKPIANAYSELHELTRFVVEAEDIAHAGVPLGQVAAACGTCHIRVGAEVDLADAAMPPIEPGLADEMAQHRAAADKLWLALVAPDPSLLDEAVWVLDAGDPFIPAADPDAASWDSTTVRMEMDIHELASRAQDAPSRREQGRAVGWMLTTCAACHMDLREPAL